MIGLFLVFIVACLAILFLEESSAKIIPLIFIILSTISLTIILIPQGIHKEFIIRKIVNEDKCRIHLKNGRFKYILYQDSCTYKVNDTLYLKK